MASPHTDLIACVVNTADGSAVAASGDYTAISAGTITLGPGTTSTFVPITIPPGTNLRQPTAPLPSP